LCVVGYLGSQRVTRAARVPGRAPVPDSEVKVLKALALAACAMLMLVTPAAAHVAPAPNGGLDAQLRHHLRTLRHDKQVLRFFDEHTWLVTDPRFRREANRQLSTHRRHLAVVQRKVAATRAAIAKQKRARQLTVLRAATPQAAICRIFGPHCNEAIAVARCESRLQTWARNGQYLGLFQMGTSPRSLFGHGPSAEEQARAAYRYFVFSGRNWSPWSCKPWW
jgi:hypothetical protein